MCISQSNTTPAVGLLTVGRSRPGFDPAWGRQIQQEAQEAIGTLAWPVCVPTVVCCG